MGRLWIEGLRTDSLYLFDWTLFGEPIRVSQALSVVMILVSAAALFWNLVIRRPSPEDMYVNRLAKQAEEAAVKESTAETEENKEERGEDSDA